MIMKKTVFAIGLAVAALGAAPASATWNWGGWGGSSGGWGGHSHHPGCGHGSSSGGQSSSGNTSSGNTSSGTQVPEPGMLGMFGLGLAGVAYSRRRRKMKG